MFGKLFNHVAYVNLINKIIGEANEGGKKTIVLEEVAHVCIGEPTYPTNNDNNKT
jgi:hypothetical protein